MNRLFTAREKIVQLEGIVLIEVTSSVDVICSIYTRTLARLVAARDLLPPCCCISVSLRTTLIKLHNHDPPGALA